MKVLQILLTFALLSSVTGLVSVVAPSRRSHVLRASQIDGRESSSMIENDSYEFRTPEVDLEKVKKFVAEKAVEEHRTVNKVIQREMR